MGRMTKEEEQQILDDLGIEKSPMFGKCGTYRMPDFNPEVLTTPSKMKDTKKIYVVEYTDKVKNTSTGIGGVFDGTTYDIALETPIFFSVQHD